MRIYTLGGYAEVGKNMSCLEVGDEAVIFDMGFYMPKLIDFEEGGGERQHASRASMIESGAIPDDSIIDGIRKKVRAIALSHCHLDHLGAVPYLEKSYDAPILGTPFTLEVLRTMIRDENFSMKNRMKQITPNSACNVSDNIELEFINITHSTLQTAMIAAHTKEGIVLYANDFKFDKYPVVGREANIKRLRELGKEGVKALIVDSLYADNEQKTPSEKVAREMLKDIMLGTENRDNAIIVTTFASHIARLKSIADFGQKLNRKIVFLGRSMAKYISAAERLNLIKFPKRCEIVSYRLKVEKMLRQIEKDRSSYLIVCTGGQGEPTSVLSRMATNQLSFEFLKDDHVIFSNKVIPVDINRANRARLEGRLKNRKVRIFSDVHVSGHASREDLRDLINTTKPENIIPAHGDITMLTALGELATEMGYTLRKNVHIMADTQYIDL